MAEELSTLSDGLADAVAGAGRVVVRVEGRRRLPASGFIWSEDGLIVTANHVMRTSETVTVGLADGKEAHAALVGRDPTTDIAVLRAEKGTFQPATRSDDLRVGHLVLALGRPGQTVQATLGIVSALGESGWRTPMGGQIDRYLQTDVVMYPGFSGGPLADVRGRVLGMNSSALVRGVSVTVPNSTIESVVDALREHGRVQRGYLGISTQPVRLPQAYQEELGQETGLLIVSVESDSPANNAGLVLGDTIVAFDESRVRHHDDLLAQLAGGAVGKKVPVKILRGGELRTLNVTVGER
jgi:S1-C subfamily serine protease